MRRVLVFGAALLSAFVLVRAGAADIPEWLAAAALLKVSDHSPETEAVYLLDEREVTVGRDGTILASCRVALSIRRPRGIDKARQLVVASGFDTRILSMKGWGVTEGRKTAKVTVKDVIETGLAPDTLYTDISIKILNVPGVEVGSLVGFEWQEERKPPSLEDIHTFQGHFPSERSRYSVALPAGWSADAYWVNWPPAEARTGTVVGAAKSMTWDLAAIPGIEDEPLMPATRPLASRLVVRFKAPGPDSPVSPAGPISGPGTRRFQGIAGPRIRASRPRPARSPRGRRTRSPACGPWPSSPRRRSDTWPSRSASGDSSPTPPGASWSISTATARTRRPCSPPCSKPPASILIISSPTRRGGASDPGSPPSLYSFNHVVLAIRLPDDVPDEGLPAVVRHPRLGRLLVFDPTSPYTPLGRLPVYLQGNTALLVAEGTGELLRLPLPAPESNLLERRGRFVLDPYIGKPACVQPAQLF